MSTQRKPTEGDTVTIVVPVEGKDVTLMGTVQDALSTQFTILVDDKDLYMRFYDDRDYKVVS